MIVCGACGHENASGADFCASCGAYLEWSGKKVGEPEEVAPPEAIVQTSTPAKGPTTIEAGKTAPVADGPFAPDPNPVPRPAPRTSTDTPPAPSSASRSTPTPSRTKLQPQGVSKVRIQSPMPAPKARPAVAEPPAEAADESAAALSTPSTDAPVAQDEAKAPAEAAPATLPPTEEEKAAAAAAAEKDARMKALVTRPIATTPVRPTNPPPSRPAPARPSGPGAPVKPGSQMGARQPTAQRPSEAKPKVPPKPPKSTKERQFRPGDLYCGNCGEGNEPHRKFCRKCGASLANAPVVATPWYKRLKRKKKVMAAGERAKGKDGNRAAVGDHKVRRGMGKAFRVLLVIAVLLLMIALLTPLGSGMRSRMASAKDKIKSVLVPSYEPIHPNGAQASSALPDHPATLAIDGTSNMAWEEAAPGDGVGQTLVLSFAKQVDIDRIGFINGVSDMPDLYLAQPRPRQLHLVFSNGKTADLTLKDSPAFQHFAVKAHAVVSVQISVVSVNTSYNGGHDMGIAEVELFHKK